MSAVLEHPPPPSAAEDLQANLERAIAQALDDHLPERHRKLLGLNKEALRKGAALAKG